MGSNGFDRFIEATKGLSDTFNTIAKQKEKKQEKLNAAATTQAGIQQLGQQLRSAGVSDANASIAQTQLGLSGGKNSIEAVNAAFKSLSRPAQDKLNQLENQVMNERANGTLTPDRLNYYKDQANAVMSTNQLISGGYQDWQIGQKLKQKQGESDIQMNQDVFKANLAVKTSQQKYDLYTKALDKGKVDTQNLKKATVPQINSKTIFPDGMNEAQFTQAVMNINPTYEHDPIGRSDLFYYYKHRDDSALAKPGVLDRLLGTMEKARAFTSSVVGSPAQPVSAPSGNANDFGAHLQELSNDSDGEND